MAVTPTTNNSAGQADGSIIVYTWVLTTANPAGIAIQLPEWADKTISWFETGDAAGAPAASISVEGSNNNVDFGALANAAGGGAGSLGALVVSVTKVASIIENPLFVRPNLTTPGTAASVTVRLTIRRAFMQRQ